MFINTIFFIFVLNFIHFSEIHTALSPVDEYFYGHEADRYDWTKHPCKRPCKDDEKPKECEYVFVLESYSSMSKACYNCPFNETDCFRPHCVPADGRPKTVYVANRNLPGVPIEVCKNDIVKVDVRNAMLSEATVIHWHGIDQIGTPYMDGVSFLTQCPILPGNKFLYVFNATSAGTYFWHSHVQYQRDDGLFDSLIIQPLPKENFHKNLYDYDHHTIIINDWKDLEGNDDFLLNVQAGIVSVPITILVNGLGRVRTSQDKNTTLHNIPSRVFKVRRNFKCRFRLIAAAGADCPVQISIDNHTILVVSLDSNDIKPIEVDALNIWNGERIDFIINANQRVDNYWIRHRGLGLCANSKMRAGIYQLSILRYEGAKAAEPKSPIGYHIPYLTDTARILNPYNKGTEHPIGSIPLLKAVAENDETVRKPDYQFHILFDYYNLDNYDFHRRHLYGYNEVAKKFRRKSLQFNHIASNMPYFPPLSQPELIKHDTFCNVTTLANKNCIENECICTHVLQVKLNSIVELILIDEGRNVEPPRVVNHPLHLHGYFFRVIAMKKFKEQISVDLIKKLDKEGKIERNLDHAPLKDTIKIPSNGYTIVRFHAANPGYWLYHCHIDRHNNIGMALIFKVGEPKDLPPKPKNFPTCGNFA